MSAEVKCKVDRLYEVRGGTGVSSDDQEMVIERTECLFLDSIPVDYSRFCARDSRACAFPNAAAITAVNAIETFLLHKHIQQLPQLACLGLGNI